ncbi:MAG: carboxy terminal-processing peptidase, partial [Planctomycetota bacterium]|nr:carboxy terminal-processing peptidase [Planctomycetota bacterium]
STHGKGTVQQLMDLSRARGGGEPGKLGALKITLSQFYRPSGNSTQNKGVVPDIELPAVSSHMDGEAELDFSIEFDTVEKAEHSDLGLVDEKILRRLKEKSRKRRGSNEEFSKVEKSIARYRKIRDRKKIPLERSRYEAEKKRFDPDDAKEEKKDPKDAVVPSDDNAIKRDFYLEEVLSITADYVAALKPASAESYRRLARAVFLLGDTKQGRALIAEGLRKHPGSRSLQKLKKGPVK